MRSINATLLSDQKSLGGDPVWTIVIGTPANTIDVSAFLITYDYEEQNNREAGLTIYLDNSGGEFNNARSGSYAYLTQGAVVEFKRGRTVAGTDYVEELPRVWVENIDFDFYSGTACCIVQCLDWRGKLARHRPATAQSWAATSATTILEWILTQVGLTRLAGSMTSTTLEFDIRVNTNLHSALRSLMRRLPEYLYAGIDAEIKWKDIDSSDASDYTLGWNADHPVLRTEAGSGAWAINSVTVNGRGSYTGTASDATQISAVGTRKWTIYDTNLSSDAECTQRATAELDLFEAQATRMYVVCRPIHGLELLDVLTLDSPPWGGDNFVGRVISYREEYNLNGRWHQVIALGATSLKDPGNQPARSRRRSGRRSRRRPPPFIPPDELPPMILPGMVPVGVIVLWSGAVATIPAAWALCDGNNGTPDLRNSFVVGAGDTYAPDDTGGAAALDLAHTHDSGTLNTDSDQHTHSPGSLETDPDSHDHTVDAGATAAGSAHNHTIGGSTGQITGTFWRTDDTGPYTVSDQHTHIAGGLNTANESAHNHAPGSLETDPDSHDHTVDAGVTDPDSHDHGVDSGATTSALADATSILPPYYALAYIMRIA